MSIIRKDLGPRPPARLKSKLSVVRPGKTVPDLRLELRSGGEFSIFSDAPGELEHTMERLGDQAVEPNPFQTLPFLTGPSGRADAQTRLALIEDSAVAAGAGHLAALMGFSVAGANSHLVASAAPGGYHAPLISRHRPMATLDQLFEALAGSLANLPGVIAFPGLLADGAFMRSARAVAAARGLAFRVAGAWRGHALSGRIDPTSGLSHADREAWQANLEKWENLQKKGRITYHVARNPAEISAALEELSLLCDTDEHTSRCAACFPAVRLLSERDRIRLHALYIDGQMIAAALQPLHRSEAWVWQVMVRPDMSDKAIDEQLIMRLTQWNLRDANIAITRVAPAAGPFLAERFWPVDEGYASLLVALRPGMERALDSVAATYEDAGTQYPGHQTE
ncbi:GNAT family N-acetyltransferase [Martelella mangrovi]|uniref:BioF2-like acetyltransferase domain-containing protein n=1 Tax=Martelella mangrovi TaxID=1397477 RepID=A0ABV2I9A2_9HYPH